MVIPTANRLYGTLDPGLRWGNTFSQQELVIDKSQSYQTRRVHDTEIDQALELIFTDIGVSHQQSQQQLFSFKEVAKLDHYDLRRQMVVEKEGKLLHAACFVPNDGGTTFVFFSQPNRWPREQDPLAPYCREMLGELVRWSFSEGATIIQVLLETEDVSRRELCLQSGFSHLTDLIYLYRTRQHSPLVVEPPKNLSWVEYDDSTHELFKTVIAQTYQDSLDCPELENIRDMEEVIRSHKASGLYDRKLWKVLFLEGQAAGVLILSPLRNSDSVELTYMGIGREYRGQKLGYFLLAEAMRCVNQAGFAGLTLAVDQRNHPACHLYTRFGLVELFRKTVMICTAS